jgi:trehalose 6-phosphate synthase
MIVVSHRGPVAFRARDDGTFEARRGAGGIVSALGPLLADTDAARRSTWIAAAIGDDDRAAVRAGACDVPGVELELLDLDERTHHLHYDVVSNGVLWFLHHGLFDLVRRPRFDARFGEAWDAYVAVNETFARAVDARAAEREVVLVQDYQLSLVPELVRAARPDLRVVHFTHTPFCGPNSIRVLPDRVATQLCAALASGPAGFHTTRWARAFAASAREVLGPGAAHEPFAASLGPDVAALEHAAATPEARAAARTLSDEVGDRLVLLRIDRIEPSKNVVRGFLAFDALLERRPGLRGRVVFVAMLYASRERLPEYLAYANEVEQAVDRVNERWGTTDWQPVLLDLRDDFERSVAGMERYDVLLVNPLKDGLNLVAKEGPVLNRRDGTVCLSRDAGAFDDLARAVLPVHPFDLEQTAATIETALALPLDDRAARAARLRELATARSPATWLADLVARAD